MHLAADFHAFQQAEVRQRAQFPMQRTRRGTSRARQFAHMQCCFRVQEERGEDGGTGIA
jgi:hypothetical protein